MPEVREPKNANSTDKKKRITEDGLKIFGERGYYKASTAEIAKETGVSLDIIYRCFRDKKNIFSKAIQLYFSEIFNHINEYMATAEYKIKALS